MADPNTQTVTPEEQKLQDDLVQRIEAGAKTMDVFRKIQGSQKKVDDSFIQNVDQLNEMATGGADNATIEKTPAWKAVNGHDGPSSQASVGTDLLDAQRNNAAAFHKVASDLTKIKGAPITGLREVNATNIPQFVEKLENDPNTSNLSEADLKTLVQKNFADGTLKLPVDNVAPQGPTPSPNAAPPSPALTPAGP